MTTELPLRIEHADALQWHDVADVVVVGFGGAGAVAALEARQQGADVLALDNFAGGGATAVSGGINYAGNTRFQSEGGIDDTAEAMFDYLWAEGVPVQPETLRRFCEQSRDNIEWLSGFGIPYSGTAYLEKCTIPPDGYFLYFTGNEMHPRFSATAKPAPRGHRIVTDGFGGNVHFAKLREAALALGVRLSPHSPVRRLVMDAENRVVGVEVAPLPQSAWAEHERLYKRVKPWAPLSGAAAEKAIAANAELESRFNERQLIRGRAGVLISAGGYIYNLNMVRRLRPEIGKAYKAMMRLGSMGCNGSGIGLGESVGGATEHMNRVFVSRNIAPPQSLLYGIMVNSHGERFINEDVYVGGLGEAVAQQAVQNSNCWLIIDSAHFWKAVKSAFNPGKNLFMLFGLPTLLNIFLGGTKRGSSLQAIARKCGIDYTRLKTTVNEYNNSARNGEADPLGKNSNYMLPLGDGPFYALNEALDNRFGFTMSFSLGGLRVDENTGAVLRNDGSAIAGLYAAGRSAVGLCSLGYQSGMSIADTVFSGRRAGRIVASNLAPMEATERQAED